MARRPAGERRGTRQGSSAAFWASCSAAGAAAIGAFGPELRATFESAQTALPRIGPFGQGATPAASTDVSLDAPVSASLVALAVGLALLGGLVAGAVGGLRAARLRPADALRRLD